jgi:1,4-dihydroxy-2-naphthoate octaprenyltransferase
MSLATSYTCSKKELSFLPLGKTAFGFSVGFFLGATMKLFQTNYAITKDAGNKKYSDLLIEQPTVPLCLRVQIKFHTEAQRHGFNFRGLIFLPVIQNGRGSGTDSYW